tara:strand:+ start:194744 stop:197689 length:2946 start_codon:yes stop_codon:yes gene_type:complete
LVVTIAILLGLFAVGSKSIAQDDAGPTDEQRHRQNRFIWDFSRSNDTNYYGWPDGWERKEGRRYPKYVKIKIAPRDLSFAQQLRTQDTRFVRAWTSTRSKLLTAIETAPDLSQPPELSLSADDGLADWSAMVPWLALKTPMVPAMIRYWPIVPAQIRRIPTLPPSLSDAFVDRFLRVDLDGGLALIQSPHVDTSHLFQYRFGCDVMTKGLRHDRVHAELVFLDDLKRPIVTHATEQVTGTQDWKRLVVDHILPPSHATSMMVRLIVDGAEDGLEDVRGTIGFDNVRIEQFPQMQIVTDESTGVYEIDNPITATATLMGLPAKGEQVRFRVFDHDGKQVAEQTRMLVSINPSETEEMLARSIKSSVSWQLPGLPVGFYRITAALVSRQQESLATETTAAVIDELVERSDVSEGATTPSNRVFGWTLPGGSHGQDPRLFAKWLQQCGVAWVKYPCWLPPDDFEAHEQVATTLSKLQETGIHTIGMLDVPPEADVEKYDVRGRRDLVAAQLFRDKAVWQPMLEPVMTRLTLKVRTWQIGADRDHSFLGRLRLRDSISTISTGLQGFGQPIDVAISWPWLEPDSPSSEVSWQAVCRSSDPPLAADELDAFLKLKLGDSRDERARTWLLLDPIAKQSYGRDARIRDLVLRMAAVRGHRVQAVFVSRPRDPEHGLLQPDGRPGELLLPYRTTSRLIGNLRSTGSLRMRSGAENLVLAGDERVVMMVWSSSPTEELMYLGDEAKVIDVWGRTESLPVEMVDGRAVQRVPINTVPKFVIGADPVLLALRMSVSVEPNQLDSLLGRRQRMKVHFTNPTRDSMFGELKVESPAAWMIDSGAYDWELQGGRSETRPFTVVLGNNAKVGTYELPIRFDLQSKPAKSITVYRKVEVGPDGLTIKANTRLMPNGDLMVSVEMVNRSPRSQAYDCMLFPPPGRQYMRRLITIRPGESARRDYLLNNGAELIGKKLLLRAAEEDGDRVLNYEIDVRR